MQIILSQIMNYFLFFVFFSFGDFSPQKTFHHAKAESKLSKGLVIKFIALHELRKKKGKMTIEIEIKKKFWEKIKKKWLNFM